MDEEQRPADDAGSQPAAVPKGEARWPMALAVLASILLQLFTPHRGRLKGWWLFPILEAVLLLVVILRDPGHIDRRTVQARRSTIVLITIMTVGTMFSAGLLVFDILNGSDIATATNLLGRGAAVWFTNVIVFSLWYWEVDRGGPAERAADSGMPPSFAFPENATPELVPAHWRATYPDYLYLAYTNATAFSPTDTLPVRTWAKMTMLLQSAISLVIAILVIARAINAL